MNSDGHENAWSADGGRASTIPLSIDGFASGTARGELNSSVFGEKAYQVVENGGDASVRDEYTVSWQSTFCGLVDFCPSLHLPITPAL